MHVLVKPVIHGSPASARIIARVGASDLYAGVQPRLRVWVRFERLDMRPSVTVSAPLLGFFERFEALELVPFVSSVIEHEN